MTEHAKEDHKENTKRRDFLIDIEKRVQAEWEKHKVYELDAEDPTPDRQKFLGTFPYPYMNGVLHLGHAFTLSKVEFACRFERLKGKRVLFPFGFHCTGMPIAACADKLKREIELYGNPPIFPPEEETEAPKKPAKLEVNKAKSKKAKTGAKKSKQAYQWNIMKEMGVAEADIPKFQHAEHWLGFFPPIAVDHLRVFGLSADFRRSFITTDVNPYYDSFIRWQFNHLKKGGFIDFGKRLSIYSPLDKQVCADHDRASGEGVLPQDYTLIKLELLPPYPEEVQVPKGCRVYLPAATLRPETMYGQTNLYVLPEGVYGIFQRTKDEVFICSERSALNLSYQELMDEWGAPKQIGTIEGTKLIGKAVKAPLATYEKVYVLPLLTISMKKGTGVVTSVPSDAPDDWAALMDLKNKPKMREKYGLTDDMVLPYEVVPIIHTPGLGNQAAADLCVQMKVQSQNDEAKLAEIKAKVYLEGFYKGEMLVGEYKGKKVSEAKVLIREKLIREGLALPYSEPEDMVVARSGCECVVALTDQWFLTYGKDEWKARVEKHLTETLQTFNPLTHKAFVDTLGWLHEWGCSREYGLGTRLPFAPQFVIESLSDSTIYMAYYTVAHLLQGGHLNGDKKGPANIEPAALTDEVWDYIFLNGKYPGGSKIPQGTLDKMRKEFLYWYPVDLRVSGKDLIGNHLTMSLYNHAAIWANDPSKWPRGFFTNGHVMINDQKMSKSTGNFMTMEGACRKYGTDATRLALADAGDGLMDANFAELTANSAILRLTKEEAWIREVLIESPDLLRDDDTLNFMDQVFDNEINRNLNRGKAAFEGMRYHDGIVACFFDMWNARDDYRANSTTKLHRGLIRRFVEAVCITLSPVCPHWTQHIWQLLGHKGFVLDARWPAADEENLLLSKKIRYLRDTANSFRSLLNKQKGGKKEKDKGKTAEVDYNAVTIIVAPEYPENQAKCLAHLQHLHKTTGSIPDARTLAGSLKDIFPAGKVLKDMMAFAALIKGEYDASGEDALQADVGFDEKAFVIEHQAFITRGMNLAHVEVKAEDGTQTGPKPATPGKPKAIFSHI